MEISSVINRMTDFDFNLSDNSDIRHYTKQKDEIGMVASALIQMHNNLIEFMEQVDRIDQEIKNIDIENSSYVKLKLSTNNPFRNVVSSMNVLLDKTHLYLNQLKQTNMEINGKNEQLMNSKKALIVQLDEINQQKEYIHFLAYHDSLTRLPNRGRFIDLLTKKIKSGQKGAVVLLDIDDFNSINDTLGHVFGDRVLESFAKRLAGLMSDKVFVSRFGGDEFLVLIDRSDDSHDLDYYVNCLASMFEPKMQIDENTVEIKSSMGISLFPEDSRDVGQLVMYADLAMYAVKHFGKNGYKFFDPSMMDDQKRKLKIEIILREAIQNNGFRIVYQPQVDMMTGRIYGYEALLRLEKYEISTEELIAIAEKNGSITKIGRIVTENVIKQLSEWEKSGLEIKPVSINYSANQLHDGSYIDFMKKLLREYDVNPRYIEFEITENIILENEQNTLNFLEQLKDLGIKISIDDFGTGYCSLNYLTFLPLDKIKLDRSLSEKFLEIENIKVMDSLIDLAHSLRLTVIAEGIETQEQVKRLKRANCDFIQGYYFSKPLTEDQIPGIHSITYTLS